MVIRQNSFTGISPRTDPTLLPETGATVAHNCRLKSGKIDPLREPLAVTDMYIHPENGLTDVCQAKTLHLWKRSLIRKDFLAWPGIVHVAPSNIFNDSRFRIFVTGETGVGSGDHTNQPCAYITDTTGLIFDRHSLCKETLPAPVVYLQSAVEDPINLRYTTFFQTWVDEYGYESGASMPSQEIVYNDGMTIVVESCDSPTDSVKRRIYKAVAGTATDTIQFVHEQSRIGGGVFLQTSFTVKDEDTGELLPNITSVPEELNWMTAMPGNFYAGVIRTEPREVCFSSIGLPTSWPLDFRYSIRDEIIGFGVSGNTLFVLTRGYPWAITGTSPDSMSASQIASPQACISERSICSYSGSVFYVSQDGICVVSESSASVTVITKAYFDKQTWSALNPQSAIMVCYDNALMVWFTLADGSHKNYMIDFDDGGGLVITTHDDYADAAFADVESDNLYMMRKV